MTAIYVIGPDTGPIKIGISTSISQRLTSLQTAHHQKLRLFHSEDHEPEIATKLERLTHRLLRDRAKIGDWFDVTPAEAKLAIERALGKLNEEDAVAQRVSVQTMPGQDLKAWRKKHNLTQSQAGIVLGARRETIIQWEGLEQLERRLWLACLYLDEHPEMIAELIRI